MDFDFLQAGQQYFEEAVEEVQPMEKVDALEFIASTEFMGETPTVFQSCAIKTYYGLWLLYPPTADEMALLNLLWEKWHIAVNINTDARPKRFILALGRRGTKCLTGDSTIYDVDTGSLLRLDDIYNNNLKPKILTLDSHYKITSTINYSINFNGKKPVYRISTRTGKTLKTTQNHKFLTISGWRQLSELTIESRIAIPNNIPISVDINTDILSDKKSRFLGYMIGDGGTHGNFSFTNTDSAILSDMATCCKEFNCKMNYTGHNRYSYRIVKNVISKNCRIPNDAREFCKIHGLYGVLSIDKEVPEVINYSSNEIIANFLKALFSCDGCVVDNGKDGFIFYSSSSYKLILQVQSLLLRFGIVGSVKKVKSGYFSNKEGLYKRFDSYKLYIRRKEDIEKYFNKIGFIGEKEKRLGIVLKKERLHKKPNTLISCIPKEILNYINDKRIEKKLSKQRLREINGRIGQGWSINREKLGRIADVLDDELLRDLSISDVDWDIINKIEYIGEEDTYDLSVEDTHNFIANDIVVHNSTLMSFFSCVSTYELITLGNPQKHFGIRDRHPIYITHVAAGGDQAEAVFTLSRDNIRSTDFFKPFIDFDKDSSTELRLFTPVDKLENDKIFEMNRKVLRGSGESKEPRKPGTINIKSVTTSGTTKRGDATYLLMLSEFAHFVRAKFDPTKSEEQLVSENPRSDYAITKALIPSVQDFGDEGRVIMESSPVEKGGEFYHYYCMAGGMEQENFANIEPEVGYCLFQFATWEVRPTITREVLDSEFRADPVGCNSEYGAHFRNPSGQFISEAVINAIPQSTVPMCRDNIGGRKHYIITLDPGGKAKKKKADTYAVSWGHAEQDFTTKKYTYIVDGMFGFNATLKNVGMGRHEIIQVDPNVVLEFVFKLVDDLGGRNYILEIAYDQFESSPPVHALQAVGLPAVETTFTNPYKAEMYGSFLSEAQLGNVKMYGVDDGGWVQLWKTEMKYLQEDHAGGIVYYHHPATGPVQTDDLADVVSNLIHRLCLRMNPTKESIKQAHRDGLPAKFRRKGVSPLAGPTGWGNKSKVRPIR
jgi:intein/homing endonuclease